MARLERFELPTARFVAEYSIQLSYRRFGRRDNTDFFGHCQCFFLFIDEFSQTMTTSMAKQFVGNGFTVFGDFIGQ